MKKNLKYKNILPGSGGPDQKNPSIDQYMNLISENNRIERVIKLAFDFDDIKTLFADEAEKKVTFERIQKQVLYIIIALKNGTELPLNREWIFYYLYAAPFTIWQSYVINDHVYQKLNNDIKIYQKLISINGIGVNNRHIFDTLQQILIPILQAFKQAYELYDGDIKNRVIDAWRRLLNHDGNTSLSREKLDAFYDKWEFWITNFNEKHAKSGQVFEQTFRKREDKVLEFYNIYLQIQKTYKTHIQAYITPVEYQAESVWKSMFKTPIIYWKPLEMLLTTLSQDAQWRARKMKQDINKNPS